MSNRIEITDDEREVAAKAACRAHEVRVRTDGKPVSWGDEPWSQPKWRLSIDAAIDAINRARTSDPVGTIRRSSMGDVAVRIGGVDEPDDWRTTWTDGETRWTGRPNSWAVIYSPEES